MTLTAKKKASSPRRPRNQLAAILEKHLARLSPVEQIKKIRAARTILARARAKRRATPSTPVPKTPTPLAARERE